LKFREDKVLLGDEGLRNQIKRLHKRQADKKDAACSSQKPTQQR